MPTDAEEIASYETISDLQRLVDKKTTHKSQIKTLDNYFKPVFTTSFDKIPKDDVEKKFKELNHQLSFLDALQARYEVRLKATSPDTYDEEVASV